MDSVDEFEDILKSTTDFPTMKKKNQPLGPVGRRHEENKSKENNFSKENNLSKPNKKLDDFDDLDDDIFNFSINKKKNDNLFGGGRTHGKSKFDDDEDDIFGSPKMKKSDNLFGGGKHTNSRKRDEDDFPW